MRSATALKHHVRQKNAARAKRKSAAPGASGPVRERNCSVARTVGILSDAWAFLVIREAFFGARRFETFRSALGLPRGTLSARLKSLTQQGIFRQVHYAEGSSRVEYRLTKAGLDLYPSFMALMQFGDRWLTGRKGPPLQLVHADCGKECKPIVACSSCLKHVRPQDSRYRDGPGAGRTPVQAAKRSRRASDPSQFMRGRPSSVSLSLQVMGDKWTFLVIREAFLGVRRFDKFLSELNIAPNILTDRLNRLIDRGIFKKKKYQDLPERYEYRLTDMGKDLYGSLVAMMAWGDRWLSHGEPPIQLTHTTCGKDFTPTVICDKCRKPVTASNMRYRLKYDPRDYEADSDYGRVAPGRI
ncbi:MAG: helix-turn-helix transcriptional regulator [Hyphomicrobiaceae bacterium]|nr:MAG: helix-turn-helix transcriptional regulator [Hyphomicrobiaceae bacterium]